MVIRQYDVFDNPSATTRAKVPYVVVLQSHLFEALPTLVIAPMMRLDHSVQGGRILVEVDFGGESLVVNTAFLTNIERRRLSRSRAPSLPTKTTSAAPKITCSPASDA